MRRCKCSLFKAYHIAIRKNGENACLNGIAVISIGYLLQIFM